MARSVTFHAAAFHAATMGLQTLASILFGAGLLLSAAALGLLVRAWRGRVTGWHSCCDRCGFTLRGLNPDTHACPECGAPLQAAAALRPLTRERDARRWGAAVTAGFAAGTLLWLGSMPRLVHAGVTLCRAWPTDALVWLLPHAPRLAGPPLRERLEARMLGPDQLTLMAVAAAAAAVADAEEPSGEPLQLLAQMQQQGLISAEQLPALLRACLHDAPLTVGRPTCRSGGAFLLSVSLPPRPSTAWITRDELRVSIAAAEARRADGSVEPLERLTRSGEDGSREFDGSVFRAPIQPGRYQCTLTARMQTPGEAPHRFDEQATAPFELLVIDPAAIRVQFVTDAAFAATVRAWLALGSLQVDWATRRVTPTLPGDVGALQRAELTLAARLLATQGEVTIDLGRVWIDPTMPAIALTPAALPGLVDSSKPLALVLAPDADLAAAMASNDCRALADRVECTTTLPAPPPPPPPPTPPPPSPVPSPS